MDQGAPVEIMKIADAENLTFERAGCLTLFFNGKVFHERTYTISSCNNLVSKEIYVTTLPISGATGVSATHPQ